MSQSYVCLHYHLVFSTKNRAPAITPEIEPRLWEYIAGTVRALGGTPVQIGGIEDHVHLLVTLRQQPSLSDMLRDIKAGSSGWVHDTFPDMRDFWWQGGYGAFTVSHSNIDAVKAYIANQREHHKKRDFKDEFRAKNDGKDEVKIPIKQRADMVGNFLDVIRGTGQLNCNVELGTSTMVAIKLAVESYRQKKVMNWDAKTEKVI